MDTLGPMWFVSCVEIVLLKRFQSHYFDRGDKIWGFSFVYCGEVFTEGLLREVLCCCTCEVMMQKIKNILQYATLRHRKKSHVTMTYYVNVKLTYHCQYEY